MKLLIHAVDENDNEIFAEELDGDAFYEGLSVIIGMKNGVIKLNPEDEKVYYSNTPEGLEMRKNYKRFALTPGEKLLIFDSASDEEKLILNITSTDYCEFSGESLEILYSAMNSESPGCIPDIYEIISEHYKELKRSNGKLMFDKLK